MIWCQWMDVHRSSWWKRMLTSLLLFFWGGSGWRNILEYYGIMDRILPKNPACSCVLFGTSMDVKVGFQTTSTCVSELKPSCFSKRGALATPWFKMPRPETATVQMVWLFVCLFVCFFGGEWILHGFASYDIGVTGYVRGSVLDCRLTWGMVLRIFQ